MDTCAICRKPIEMFTAVPVVVKVANATHWSPAEYEELTVHYACQQAEWGREDRPDPNAK